MKKILTIVLIIFSTLNLIANSKGSLVDRKKNFDSKAKFVLGIQEVITSEKLATNIQELKDTVTEVDTTFRSGEKDKIRKVISIGEVKVAAFQRDYSAFLSGETKELIEAYSAQATTAAEKEAELRAKPTVEQTTMKEKSSQYFTIAKTDYANATKFERDGNLQYAIQLFKRSLDYTVLAFDKSKFPLPEKFSNLSKKKGTTPIEPESEVSPIGTHTNPSKETKQSPESKTNGPIKALK